MGLGATRGAVGLFLLGLSSTVSSAADGWTTKHEAGRCAIRGQCGKQGFFGSELPCPDNGLAKEPTSSVRQKLVSICGDKWAKGAVESYSTTPPSKSSIRSVTHLDTP